MQEAVEKLLARRRFLDGEKSIFLDELKNLMQSNGYDAVVSRDKSGSVTSSNILFGPIHTAKAVIVTYYDTPQRMPKILQYTPLNMQRKVVNNFLLRSMKEFVTIVIGIMLFLLTLALFWSNNSLEIMDVVAVFIILLAMVFIKTAIQLPSKYSAKRNNSSVALMLDVMLELSAQERDKVAFAFVDNGTMDMQGDRIFSETLVQLGLEIPVIMLDAVGANEPLLLQYLASTKSLAQRVGIDAQLEPAVEGLKSTIHCYQNALLLTRGTKIKKDYVIRGVNTNKDTVVDTQQMQSARTALLQIIRKII